MVYVDLHTMNRRVNQCTLLLTANQPEEEIAGAHCIVSYHSGYFIGAPALVLMICAVTGCHSSQ